MTATPAVRVFAELNDAELEVGRSELASLLGPEEPLQISWLRHLGRRPDGSWVLAVRTVVPGIKTAELSIGYDNPFGPRITTSYHAIAEGVELLRGGAGRDADLLERDRDTRAAASEAAEARRKEDDRMALQRQKQERQAYEDDRRNFAGEAWDQLSPLAQALYWQALAFEDLGLPDLATRTREIARSAGTRLTATQMGFPRRKWL